MTGSEIADPLVRSILLYVESIHDARGFMSAARAASRNKPVLAHRPGQALHTALTELAAATGAVLPDDLDAGAASARWPRCVRDWVRRRYRDRADLGGGAQGDVGLVG